MHSMMDSLPGPSYRFHFCFPTSSQWRGAGLQQLDKWGTLISLFPHSPHAQSVGHISILISNLQPFPVIHMQIIYSPVKT